ncbi:HlyD family secretion protein [Thiohalomonas denitrificans]|uniref:HlyD family secretion protein n=1 Tax=Thiohalomonas denitrificans TaxID=415747 RepID=A0A1G5QN22_9GAMM|nr:HlyD family efflux transporter periplasmic adaptor subunit [Thiohalomonas denitrificans]SCZ63132.1 HlyD family secretion protein [Thiohalomonas denitrificans]
MFRSRRRWLITASVALFFLLAFILTVKWVGRPDLPEGIASANGRLEATQVDIATKNAGRLSEVLVSEGDNVRKAQVVARMDVTSLEANLRQAQAEFQEAVQAMYAARAKVAQEESAVEFAAAEFSRNQDLLNQQLIPQQQADLARSRLRSERAALAAARASVSQAEASIAAAQAKIDAIQAELDDSILKSPITARVLYRLAEPGEVLPVGGKVLTLIDRKDIYMTAFFPTQQAGQTGVGSEARIVLDARPEVPLPARISFISPEAQFTPKEVETESEREKLVFRVRAHVDPSLIEERLGGIATGVPGTLHVRVEPLTAWPEHLQPLAAED